MCTVRHKEIQEKAKEFRKVNGNADITNKEMLIYLMHKIDDVYEQMLCQAEKCDKRFLTKFEGRIYVGFIVAALLIIAKMIGVY